MWGGRQLGEEADDQQDPPPREPTPPRTGKGCSTVKKSRRGTEIRPCATTFLSASPRAKHAKMFSSCSAGTDACTAARAFVVSGTMRTDVWVRISSPGADNLSAAARLFKFTAPGPWVFQDQGTNCQASLCTRDIFHPHDTIIETSSIPRPAPYIDSGCTVGLLACHTD